MKYGRPSIRMLALIATVLLALPAAPSAHSQVFMQKWLNVGELHSYYSAGGAETSGDTRPQVGLVWPGISRHNNHRIYKGFWVAAQDFTDEAGHDFPVKVAHIGPRSLGIGEVFPEKFDMVSRFEPPVVTVNGFETFDRPAINDEVDPSLQADRMIHNVFSTVTGVSVERKIMQFSQEYHDDYHLLEYTFTNTGNTDDDPEIELPGQDLKGVRIMFLHKYRPGGNMGRMGGAQQMHDAMWPGSEWDDSEFRAHVTWGGFKAAEKRFNSIGGPVWDDGPWYIPEGDTVGRLASAHHTGRVTLHADDKVYPADVPLSARQDDISQPSTMAPLWGDDTRTTQNDPFNAAMMQFEYDLMSAGRQKPHGRLIVPDGNYATATADPSAGLPGGYIYVEGFGPYDIPFGETVRVVIAEGIYGLSPEAALEIGRAYKQSGADDNLVIAFDADGDGQIGEDEAMTKNEWIMTTRDSVEVMFGRAMANFNSGYDIPQPPRPPRTFAVKSGTDRILMNWETYEGENPPGGFEIWRSTRVDGFIDPYQLVTTLPPDAKSYEDTDVIRGLNYYYYIQAVGNVNDDPTGNTPTGVRLKSSRYWTQTYDPVILKRAPGSTLEAMRIVPNPYNLASAQEVRWPDQQDRLGFLDVPGNATINIYTQLGEHIRTIEHNDGSGDAYWNLTTESNQVVASGIYIAVVKNNDTGEQLVRKFVIIR